MPHGLTSSETNIDGREVLENQSISIDPYKRNIYDTISCDVDVSLGKSQLRYVIFAA